MLTLILSLFLSSLSYSPPIHHPSTSFSFMHQPFYLFLFLFLSCTCFILRDKAPGQRECDSSIDNINKCIRDIEQASLAAVSQNLASRDDISLEVSNDQNITWHLPQTTSCIFLYPSPFACLSMCSSLSAWLVGYHYSPFCFQFESDCCFFFFKSSCCYFCLAFKLWIFYWWL